MTNKHQNPSERPRKPPNSFFRYKNAMSQKIIEEYNVQKNSDISRIASKLWKEEDPAIKEKYNAEARNDFEEHKKKYPDFLWPSKAKKYKDQAGSSSLARPKKKHRISQGIDTSAETLVNSTIAATSSLLFPQPALSAASSHESLQWIPSELERFIPREEDCEVIQNFLRTSNSPASVQFENIDLDPDYEP